MLNTNGQNTAEEAVTVFDEKPNKVEFGRFEKVQISNNVSIDIDVIFDFFSQKKLMLAYTILDQNKISFNTKNVSKILNIGLVESSQLIDSLEAMNLISKKDDGTYESYNLKFDQKKISLIDLLNIFKKNSYDSLDKISSNDFFSSSYELMSKEIILKYENDILSIIDKIIEESKGKNDLAVYSSLISFAKMTRNIKD